MMRYGIESHPSHVSFHDYLDLLLFKSFEIHTAKPDVVQFGSFKTARKMTQIRMMNMQTVPSLFTLFAIFVSSVNGELVLDPACSSSIGCFHDCDSSGQSCTFLVTWAEEGDEVKFQIKAAMPAVSKKWLAVGFSADTKMGSDSVTACEIENTSDFGGDVYHSYNKDTGYSNQRLTTDAKLGIRAADFKLVNGIFMCEFYQTKAPANAPSEIFDLKNKWYIMYAYGDMDGDNKLRHSINPAPPSTPEQVNFTQTQVFAVPRQASDKLELDPACGDTKGCFHDCDGMGKQCTFIVIWEDKGLEVEVKIKTYLPTVSKKWFAIGFSEDMKMGSDSVTTCEIENTSNFGGDVYHSYNKDTGYSNQRLTTDEKLGIRVADFELVDGIFMCEFYQTKAPANASSEIFDLKDEWYIMYAYGDMNGDIKLKHRLKPKPPITASKVNFAKSQVFAVPQQQNNMGNGLMRTTTYFHILIVWVFLLQLLA